MASLSDEFQERLAQRAERGQPADVRGTMERNGWTARDLAEKLGVSERTARRYRQENRIPDRRPAQREALKREASGAAQARQRRRMERRGITSFTAAGQYAISKSKYKTGPNAPVRTAQDKIPAAVMRDYFAALDQGDPDAADQILNDGLAEAYGAPGLHMTDVDDVDFTI